MKTNLIIAGITAIALLTSCAKENLDTAGRTVVLNATMEEIDAPASKTSISDTGAIIWNEGDQILAVDEDNNKLTMKVKELKEGGKKAVFEGEVPEGQTFGNIKYAFYPESKFKVAADGAVTVTPMRTSYLTNLTNQIPSCANVAGGDALFKNICGIVEMNIEAGDLVDEYGENQNKVGLSISADSCVFGSFTFDPEDFSLKPAPGTSTNELHSFMQEFDEGHYIMILPEYTGKLTINARDFYNYIHGSINTANLEIEKGKYITMPTLTISYSSGSKYVFTKKE